MIELVEKNVPEVRFTEFDGKWIEQPLSDFIFSLDAGVSVNSSNNKVSNHEKGILKTSALSGGIFRLEENKIVPDKKEIQRLKESVKADTIIVSRMNTPALVGENAYVEKDAPNIFLPDRLWAAKPKANSEMRFLAYITGNGRTRRKISDLGTGTSGSMKNIGKAEFLQLKVKTPSLPEQQKIASFLNAVDEKIAQLQEKKTLLEAYKKGCMQKLFSQTLRFKDDNGNDYPDWEQAPLEKVATIKKGNQLNREDMIHGGKFPVINGGITASGYTNTTNMKGERITISEGGNSCGYVSWQSKDFWLGGHCYSLHLKDNSANPKYMLQFLLCNQAKIMRLRVGSGLPNIQKHDLEKLSIAIPLVGEQQKIANFLSAIDDKITHATAQLEQTKTFKKGLLQKMFV